MFRLVELGRFLSSRDRARTAREHLEGELLRRTSVTVDAQGVETLSHSFADELFGVLVEQHGEEWFRLHIRVVNLSANVRLSVLNAIKGRVEEAALA